MVTAPLTRGAKVGFFDTLKSCLSAGFFNYMSVNGGFLIMYNTLEKSRLKEYYIYELFIRFIYCGAEGRKSAG